MTTLPTINPDAIAAAIIARSQTEEMRWIRNAAAYVAANRDRWAAEEAAADAQDAKDFIA